MKRLPAFLTAVCLVALPVAAHAQQTASVSGSVTDASEGFPLTGANVVLLDANGTSLVTGAATGTNGRYEIVAVPAGAYVLAFRFVGYREERVPLTLSAGETRTVDVALTSTGFDLNMVVVTASRQAEKVLDAPASISVLDAREIEAAVLPNSIGLLQNTTGVDVAQTGIDRHEVVLRGFNNAFSSTAYVLTDYRRAAVASLGVNGYQFMPITQIDLERIEVVRGPGSALYGAGVDAGVIHFITKDPFHYPGTTLSVGGGERSAFMGSLRHAGVLGERLGYKLVGNYTRADEWNFDPADPLDRIQLDSFRPDALPVDYDNWKYNLTGTLAYRLRPDVTLTANAGFSSAKSIFLSGIGTLQSDGFGYSFGQVRLDAGRLFAQAFVNVNDAGNSFVYRQGAVREIVDHSLLFNTQAQYDFGDVGDRLRVIVGADFQLTDPDTRATINGRNEGDDQIQEMGAYAQGTLALSPRFDLTAALRSDYNNVVDVVQLSPRAALVYKASPVHSVRATFNRAFSSPGTTSLFLDINAGAAGPLTIQARGAVHGFHFQRDAAGRPIASSLIPAVFGSPMPVGMPLGIVYQQVYGGLAAIPTAQLQAILAQQGINLSEEQVAGLVTLLSPQHGTNVTGTTQSNLGFLNLTTLQVDRTAADVVDISPLRQTITETYEIGYKGLIGERVLFAVDAYHARRRNHIGPLRVETPFVLAPAVATVIGDLQGAIAEGIAGNAQLMAQLDALGLPPQAVAGLLTQLAAADLQASLPAAGTPIGIVQPQENAVPGQLLLSYRNYQQVDYFGVDVSTQIMASDRLNFFGNASWLSDNFFIVEPLGTRGAELELSMNAPKIKVRGGFDYAVPRGWRLNAALRHVGSFDVRSGPYSGTVEAFTLLDLGAGYDLEAYVPGMRIDVSVLNVLDNVHRQFIGAPQMGRLALARIIYTI